MSIHINFNRNWSVISPGNIAGSSNQNVLDFIILHIVVLDICTVGSNYVSARNGPVYAGIPYRDFFVSEFHTGTSKLPFGALISKLIIIFSGTRIIRLLYFIIYKNNNIVVTSEYAVYIYLGRSMAMGWKQALTWMRRWKKSSQWQRMIALMLQDLQLLLTPTPASAASVRKIIAVSEICILILVNGL
jgi:hypothetical protein